MVKIISKIPVGIQYTCIFVGMYVLLSAYCLIGAMRLGHDEPMLVLLFFGYPSSWVVISGFDSFFNWLGSYGCISRRIAEWVLLIFFGLLQYFLIGFSLDRYADVQEKANASKKTSDGTH